MVRWSYNFVVRPFVYLFRLRNSHQMNQMSNNIESFAQNQLKTFTAIPSFRIYFLHFVPESNWKIIPNYSFRLFKWATELKHKIEPMELTSTFQWKSSNFEEILRCAMVEPSVCGHFWNSIFFSQRDERMYRRNAGEICHRRRLDADLCTSFDGVLRYNQ